MRRAPIITSLALAASAMGLACGDHPREPVLPDPDFTPVLVVDVGNDGLQVAPGGRDKPGVSVDPPRVPTGSVIEVRNTSGTEQRVVGNDGDGFDTGGLLPDEATTVVLVEPGELTITDVDRADEPIVLDVFEQE